MREPQNLRHLVTHCDYNYLPRAIVLIESIAKKSEDYVLILVCHDELSYSVMRKRSMQNVKLVKLSEIETHFEELSEKKYSIKPIEYIFLLSPFILKFCLESLKLEHIVYVDSDICFFSSIDPIFDETYNSQVGITSHNFPTNLKHLEENGKFNVGVLFFRNSKEAVQLLNWWADRCLESTSIELGSPDVFGDQKYLDLFVTILPSTHVFKNLGINAAPWNCHEITFDNNRGVNINGYDLVCFHFSGVKASKNRFIVGYHRYGIRPKSKIKKHIYRPYVRQLYELNKDFNINGDSLRPSMKIRAWIRALIFGDYIFLLK